MVWDRLATEKHGMFRRASRVINSERLRKER